MLKVLVSEGETVAIGAVVGSITTEIAEAPATEPIREIEEKAEEEKAEEKEDRPPEAPAKKEEPAPDLLQPEPEPSELEPSPLRQILSPSVRRLVAEKNIDVSAITGTGPGNRVTKGDVLLFMEKTPPADSVKIQPATKAPAISQDDTLAVPAALEQDR